MFTQQTIPAEPEQSRREVAESSVFSLHAGIAAEGSQRTERSIRLRSQCANNQWLSNKGNPQPDISTLLTTGHLISAWTIRILELCGGRNIFADFGELAPAVTVESVVDRNPEALFAGSADDEPFAEWRRWPHLHANRYRNYFVVNSDEIGRPTTRLMSAAASVCEQLETARENRRIRRQ